ncbi:MAG: PAS domain S-box protein [Desulfobacteraceae bacterium]|nr:PAS domain S-box protein [Desulfobacteraceae bacterium]
MLNTIWISAGIITLLLFLIAYTHLNNRRLQRTIAEQSLALATKTKRLSEMDTHRHKITSVQERTEARLRGYLDLMDTLINTIPNPIYFKDGDGVYRGCNKAFAKQILGLSRADIIGSRPEEISGKLPGEEMSFIIEQERKMKRNSGIYHFESRIPCADGRHRYFLFTMAIVNSENNALGNITVMMDLTEKNQAETHRVQKEKLQAVLETAGGVCHELNQPLQTITGYAEILLGESAGNSDNQKFLSKIKEQTDRMAGITRKLQNITRFETRAYPGGSKIIDIDKSSGT